MAEFINKTFISCLILGCLDILVSLCLGATLFIFFMKWDSFNSVIDNVDGNIDNDLVNDNKSNYHLLVEEEGGVEQVISKTNSLEENDGVENPPVVLGIIILIIINIVIIIVIMITIIIIFIIIKDYLFGWVKFL